MITNIRNKSLVLLLISATLYQTYGRECGQEVNSSGEITIKDVNCQNDLSAIIDTACDAFKKILDGKNFQEVCGRNDSLKANSSQRWLQSLQLVADLIKGNKLTPDKALQAKRAAEPLTQAYETYFKPYFDRTSRSKVESSKLRSPSKSSELPSKTAVVEVKSVEIQTDLDLIGLDSQYSTIGTQLKEIENLFDERDALKNLIAELERNIKNQQVGLDAKNHELSKAKIDKAFSEQQENTYKQTIERLEREINQKLEEIAKIKKDTLAKNRENAQLTREQKEHIRQLEEKEKGAVREIEGLKRQLKDAQQENANMRQSLEGKEAAYKKQREEQLKLKTQLEKNNTELEKIISALQRQIDDQQVDLDSRDHAMKKIQIDNASLQSQNQQYAQQVDVLKGQMSEKNEAVRNLKEAQLLLKKEHNKLIQEQEDKISSENAQLQAQISTLEGISRDAQDDNARLKSRLLQFLSQIKNGEMKHAELKQQIDHFKTQVQDCKTHIKELEKALAEQKKDFEDARKKWEKESAQAAQELLNSVKKSEDSIGSAKEIIGGAIEEKIDLLGAVAIVTDTLDKLSGTIAEKEREIRKLSENNKEEKNRIQKEIAELNKIVKQLMEEKKQIEQKEVASKQENERLIRAIKSQAEKHDAEMHQAIAKSDQTTEEKQALKKEVSQQKEELDQLIKSFEDLKISSAKTVDDLNKKTSEVQEVYNKISKEKEINEQLKNKLKQKNVNNRKLHKEKNDTIKQKDDMIKQLTKQQIEQAQKSELNDLKRNFPNIQWTKNPSTFSDYLNNIRVVLKSGLAQGFENTDAELQLYQAYQGMLAYMEDNSDVSLWKELPQDVSGGHLSPEHRALLGKTISDLQNRQKDTLPLRDQLQGLVTQIQSENNKSEKFLLMQKYYVMQRDFSSSSPDLEPIEKGYLGLAVEWLNTPNLSEEENAERTKILFETGPKELKTLVKNHQDTVHTDVARQNAEMEKIKQDLESSVPDSQSAQDLYIYVIKLVDSYKTLKNMHTTVIQEYKKVLLEQIQTTYQQLLDAVFSQPDVTVEQKNALQDIKFPAEISKAKTTMYTKAHVKSLERHMSQKEREIAENTKRDLVRKNVDSAREKAKEEANNSRFAQTQLANLYQAYDTMNNNRGWFKGDEFDGITQELIQKYGRMVDLEVAAHQDTIIPENIMSISVSDSAPQELKNFSESKVQEMMAHNEEVRKRIGQEHANTQQKAAAEERKNRILKLYESAQQESENVTVAQENLTNLYQAYTEMQNHPQEWSTDDFQIVANELAHKYKRMIELELKERAGQIIPDTRIQSVTHFPGPVPQEVKELAEYAYQAMIAHNDGIHQQMVQEYQNIVHQYNVALQYGQQQKAAELNHILQQYQADIQQREAQYNTHVQQMAEEYQEATAQQAKAASRATVEKLLAPFVAKASNHEEFASSLQALREAYREMQLNPQYYEPTEIKDIEEKFVFYYQNTLLKFINNQKNKEISDEIKVILYINTSGLPQHVVSEITYFQKEVENYIQKHNSFVQNQKVSELFEEDLKFSKSVLQEDLEHSSFASLLVTLQALYNISALCADYAIRYPNHVKYFQENKALAEKKFEAGYKSMLKRAEAIYGKVAPIMFQKDEEAIRSISVPTPLKGEIQQYLETFFQKVKSQVMELENHEHESDVMKE